MKSTEQFAAEVKLKHNVTLTSNYSGAHKEVTFLCPEGHENSAAATNLLQRGYRCKECITGRKIQPKIEWTDDKVLELQGLFDSNKTTKEVAVYYNTTEAAIHNAVEKFEVKRTRSLNTTDLLKEALAIQGRKLVNPTKVYSAHETTDVVCTHNHVSSQLVANIVYKGTGCPSCFTQQPSKEQQELLAFIKANYKGWVLERDRSILEGKELDIVIPDLGIALEYNGTYWHGEHKISKNYHLDKTNAVADFGFRLIHINSWNWANRKDVVKSKLLSILQPHKRIGARKTKVVNITWAQAKEFLERTHIQGAGAPTKYNYGLTLNEELVAIATFQSPRFTKGYDMELVRFSTSKPIQGGASKLLTHAYKLLKFQSLITYALKDWSDGSLYKTLGFTHIGDTEPNYAYYKRHNKINRYSAQKHLLESMLNDYDPKLSESENMKLNGWSKMYDTGSQIWVSIRPPHH